MAGTLSGAIKSAEIAKSMLPEREIHVVDSQGASMAEAILCFLGQEMAAGGSAAEEIAEVLTERANDLRMFVSLETLEYLKKGGRISGTQAAIGSILSVKPIIAVEHGLVETADKPRTRSKSRERCIELIRADRSSGPRSSTRWRPDVDAFKAEVVRPGRLDPADVSVDRRAVRRAASRPGLRLGAAVLYQLAR